jgi:quercetin dioxygenase-like cupin family protein
MGEGMSVDDFPAFMKNKKNLIAGTSQFSDGIEGYVFDGVEGSQLAFWRCPTAGPAKEHTHEYDEYFVVVQGQYKLVMEGKEIVLNKGDEAFIPKGTAHSGSRMAGTRTIHAFGGHRAERANEI